MSEFEALIGLLLAAIMLAAVARKVGVPYPAFLALGGAVLAFLPGAPALTIEPHLALAVFVPGDAEGPGSDHEDIHRRALAAARQVIFDMRARDEIGDDAFHQLEEEFDWIEMGTGGREGAELNRNVSRPSGR